MLELGELLERKGPGGTDGAGRRDGVSRGVGPGLRARRLLLVGAVVLVVVALLQLSAYALEPTIGTLRFYVKLAGTSSEQYCPDYLPLVRETLAPYRNASAAASADEAVLQVREADHFTRRHAARGSYTAYRPAYVWCAVRRWPT